MRSTDKEVFGFRRVDRETISSEPGVDLVKIGRKDKMDRF